MSSLLSSLTGRDHQHSPAPIEWHRLFTLPMARHRLETNAFYEGIMELVLKFPLGEWNSASGNEE